MNVPKGDLGSWSSSRFARNRSLTILGNGHIDKLVDPRSHQHVQQRFRLVMTSRVLRHTRVRTIIVLGHARNTHLSRLRIDQESVGHGHVLLGRVLDPGKLGHWFAGGVAHNGKLLLLDRLEFLGQMSDNRLDLHLHPDVALDQFTGLDDHGSARVDAIVRLVHGAD